MNIRHPHTGCRGTPCQPACRFADCPWPANRDRTVRVAKFSAENFGIEAGLVPSILREHQAPYGESDMNLQFPVLILGSGAAPRTQGLFGAEAARNAA